MNVDSISARIKVKKLIAFTLVLAMTLGVLAPILTTNVYAETKVDTWKANTYYKVNDIVSYQGSNYKCLQAHKAIGSWEPTRAKSLWSPYYGQVKPKPGNDKDDKEEDNQTKPNKGDGFEVDFQIPSDWGSGMTANVKITNTSKKAIKNWSLKFKMDKSARILSLWNGNVKIKGEDITVDNAGWNSTIRPGQSVNFGMSISYSGGFKTPTKFELNGKEVTNPVKPTPNKPDPTKPTPNKPDPTKPDPTKPTPTPDNGEATVVVKVEKPGFDKNLFTPMVTVDGTAKKVEFDKTMKFTVSANKDIYISASSFTKGDKVYKASISENNLKLNKNTTKDITIKYNESVKGDVDNYYVGYFQSWSDKWASKGKDTHLANLPEYVNVVMLAFAKPDMNYTGNLNLQGTGLEFSYDGKVLKEAIDYLKEQNPDTKVIISVGGQTYTNWANMNYKNIAKFLKDFNLDGVDLDYEPAGGFNTSYDANGKITWAKEDEFVSIINNMRKEMPRPAILCATAWSVGAYGEDQWKNAKPGPFASTGMMLPIFRKAGDKIDMVNVMGYNAGQYDPIDALKAFKNYYDGPVNMGVMVPPEDWGGHVWTLEKVAKTARYVNENNVGGMMIWSLQRTHGNPSYQKPDAQMMSTVIAQDLELGEADKPLFPLSNSSYKPQWGDKFPVKGDNSDNNNGSNGSDGDKNPDNNGDNNSGDVKLITKKGLVVEGKNYNDNGNTFTTDFTVKNPNTTYKWDSGMYNVWGFTFETSSKVKSISGAKSFKQEGNKVTVLLNPWETTLALGEARNITVNYEKKGNNSYPSKLSVQFMRGENIYPTRPSLPSSYSKNKASLSESDLIKNKNDYYKKSASKINDGLILYNTPSATQINIGLADDVYVNLTSGIKMWVPSKYMAMGLGYIQEIYGINPNYMAALGTKENFSFAVYPTREGALSHPVDINGQTWYWGMTSGSVDGPFQQETPNFNEVKDFFPDSFAEGASHDAYTNVATDINDKKFIKASIASAASLTMTREYMYAVPSFEFKDFVQNAKDESAEDVLLTYIYNRGLYSVDGKVFKEDRATNMNSNDIIKTLGYSGFADHVPTVLNIMDKMNNETKDIYDIKLTKEDVGVFLKELRDFYPNGVPTDAEWSAMTKDVNKTFDVLAKHWGDNTISYRYDFLTIVRVIKSHLPSSIPPSPKGINFGYQVMNRN